jgi:hypothetical protein
MVIGNIIFFFFGVRDWTQGQNALPLSYTTIA